MSFHEAVILFVTCFPFGLVALAIMALRRKRRRAKLTLVKSEEAEVDEMVREVVKKARRKARKLRNKRRKKNARKN